MSGWIGRLGGHALTFRGASEPTPLSWRASLLVVIAASAIAWAAIGGIVAHLVG